MKKVTLKTIADEVGVTPSTVSRVLRGDATCYISKDRKEKIFDLTDRLNYSPNFAARNLVTGKTSHVAFVLCQFAHLEEHGPFTYKIIDGIRDYLTEKGYILSVVTIPRGDIRAFERLCAARNIYDGIIFGSGVVSKEELKIFSRSGMSGVFFADDAPYPEGFSFVQTDKSTGVEEAVSHLKDKGSENIAFFGYGTSENIANSRKMFKESLKKNGLEFEKRFSYEFPVRSVNVYRLSLDAYLAADRVVDDFPEYSSVFCTNDFVALSLCEKFEEKGIEPGRDVSVVGIDNIEELLGIPDNERFLTTIHKPREEMGRRAADILLKSIESRDGSLSEKFPCRLVVRKSTV